MTKLVILLAAIVVGLYFVIGLVARSYDDEMVEKRFLESEAYSAIQLRKWIATARNIAAAAGERTRSASDGYAFPVLFPLDLLFMIFLGAFLALGSVALAAPARLPEYLILGLLVLPILYVAVDLAEDTLLVRMLLWPDIISDGFVGIARALTTIKIASVALAGLQFAVLGLVAAVFWFRPPA